MNLTETNNTIIDKFMGSEGKYISHKDRWGGEVWGSYIPNCYHSDWNLLINVVKKCKALQDSSSKNLIADIYDALYNTDINMLHNTCLLFIKWYNDKNSSEI
jgi:hypothetical protein